MNYLHSELHGLRQIQRSMSPTKLMAKSSRHSSRSPRPPNTGPPQLSISTIVHDSRPDITAWFVLFKCWIISLKLRPAPPPQTILGKPTHSKGPLATTSTGTSPIPEFHFQSGSTFGEDSSRLLSMFLTSSGSPGKLFLFKMITRLQGGMREREFELRRKIQNLEETVAEYERQKFSVMGTFSEYREYVAERERTLEAEYSNKIIALSEEVLSAKKDFESRMKSFQSLQEQFNNGMKKQPRARDNH